MCHFAGVYFNLNNPVTHNLTHHNHCITQIVHIISGYCTATDWLTVTDSMCRKVSAKSIQRRELNFESISREPMTRRAIVWIGAAVGIYTMGINTINCVSG